MAAVTAITNPMDNVETLLFYCTTDQQVGLSTSKDDDDAPGIPGRSGSHAPKHGGSDPDENTPPIGSPLFGEAPERAPMSGVIKNPSSFGSILYKNLICVYGIRIDGKICLVSPAFSPLKSGPTTKFNSLAACGDGKKTGWLYYLDNDPATIREFRLNVGASVVLQAEPNDDSYLCAYYNSGKRYCIYQAVNGLSIIDGNSGSGGPIRNTSNAKKKTPMAVINNNGVIYLYYSDISNNPMRIVQQGGAWGSSAIVDGASPMADGTQLTVAMTKERDYNMLFYLPQDGGDGYHRFMDPAVA